VRDGGAPATPQLKRDLKAGRGAIEEVLSGPPVFVQSAKVADLLLALPKYGPVKVNKLLSRCRIAPSETIGGLSDRQHGGRGRFKSRLQA
jgi:hypothetical protein